MSKLSKYISLSLGFIFLGLGMIGIALPILPTTPFMILAVFFFSKSSPKMKEKILSMPGVGPLVRDWNEHQVIRPKAKVASTIMILLVFATSIYSVRAKTKLIIMLIFMALCLLFFILTRNSKKN